MNIHANKTIENNSKTVAHNFSKKKINKESTLQFTDNRPEAITQRKQQEMINDHFKVKNSDQLQSVTPPFVSLNTKEKIVQREIIQGTKVVLEGGYPCFALGGKNTI